MVCFFISIMYNRSMKFEVLCKCGKMTIRLRPMEYSECFECKQKRHRKHSRISYEKNKTKKAIERKAFIDKFSNVS